MACSTAVETFGWITLILLAVKVIYNVIQFVYVHFIGHLLGLGMDLRKCGPWAVVTGSTDGIGKKYAELLAMTGLNILLVSRSPTKLEIVAEEIRKSCKKSIQVKTLAVDFTDGQSIYAKLKTELDQLEIGILVNNVGMAADFAQPFAEMKTNQAVADIINCNVVSMARMTHLVLPQMIQRKRGVIINIGSIFGAFSTPLSTIYGATKGFVDKFSRDLSAECRAQGITVQTVHPGPVKTNMSKVPTASLAIPDAITFTRAALKTLGLTTRTGGYWYHSIQLYWGEIERFLMPGFMEQRIMKWLLDMRKRFELQYKNR